MIVSVLAAWTDDEGTDMTNMAIKLKLRARKIDLVRGMTDLPTVRIYPR
jgi:hypothetical protein